MPELYVGDDYDDDDDEDLAYDEILGDDLDDLLGEDDDILGDDEILGADKKSVRKAKMRQALKRRLASRHAVVVRRKRPRANQEQVLGFPATSVAIGASASITVNPQRTFRTERFTVPSTIAPFFTIDDLIIGRESMFVTADPVPAQQFTEVGVGVRLRGYTANLGNQIVIDVTNIDTVAARTFRASIVGTTLV